jgi:hypothetical protein
MPLKADVVARSLEIICDFQEADGGIAATRADDATLSSTPGTAS